MNYGLVEAGVITQAIVATESFVAKLDGTWIELPYGVSKNWNYDGADFTDENGDPPPIKPVKYRTLLNGMEWVDTFTDTEWAWLKVQRAADTAAGTKLDRLMDAIRWTDSINLQAAQMDNFYTWLSDQGIPGGQTRIDELRQGIPDVD